MTPLDASSLRPVGDGGGNVSAGVTHVGPTAALSVTTLAAACAARIAKQRSLPNSTGMENGPAIGAGFKGRTSRSTPVASTSYTLKTDRSAPGDQLSVS